MRKPAPRASRMRLAAYWSALIGVVGVRVLAGFHDQADGRCVQIERIALDVNGKPAEWRLSVCRTDETHYVSDLR